MDSASATSASAPLLRTKFYRPSLPSDLVDRPRLIDQLNCGLDGPLTLITAPAGYGKSILTRAWLNTCERPSAWLSLDETIDDLGVFLAYFVAAIRTIFPGTLRQTETLLAAINLPPLSVLVGSLINELDEFERDFVMVLDDYHTIHKPEIHDLLNTLLRPPAQRMHLVLIARKDPPLPKSLLLARKQLNEVRLTDLRFSADETAAFMQNALGSPLPAAAIAALADRTEGWIASLRLAALTLRYSPDTDSRVAELQALEHDRNLTDYLMSEVLAQTPPAIADFLLKTAILDRMCDPLCAALLGRADFAGRDQTPLEWLEQNNLFIVALDNERRWYRYHHLFRTFLRDRLARRCDAAEVARLHARAGAWFAGQDLLEEALQHALQGHDTPAAVRLMAEHRHALMDAEEWQFHERMLHMFPAETVTAHADLTLMAAWVARYARFFDLGRVLDLLDRAASLAAQMPDQPEHARHLQGEIDTLRITVVIEAAGDPETVIGLGQQALATTPRAWYYVRAIAWLWLAVAYQMAGRLDQAYAALVQKAKPRMGRRGHGWRPHAVSSSGLRGICRRYRRWPAAFVLSARPITRTNRWDGRTFCSAASPINTTICRPLRLTQRRWKTCAIFAHRWPICRAHSSTRRSARRAVCRTRRERSLTWQSLSCVRPGAKDSCSWRKHSRWNWSRGKAISVRPASGRRRSAHICRSH